MDTRQWSIYLVSRLKEECKLILEGPLKKKTPEEKANYLRLWSGSVGRKHVKSLIPSETNLKKPDWLFDRLEEYCKPKCNTLLAATELKRLEQGDMSLLEFIKKLPFWLNHAHTHQKQEIGY